MTTSLISIRTAARVSIGRGLVTAVVLLALSACGFHLRDALMLPPDLGPLRVVSPDPYSSLAQSLSEALERAGATPAAAVSDAPSEVATPPVANAVAPPAGTGIDVAPATAADAGVATLRIISERWASTPLSVDQNGRAQEYALRYAVIFRLNRADGSDLVPRQVIELSRDYISVPTNSSGTEGEREILTRELRKEMVASILRRIDAASRGIIEAPTVPQTTP